MGLPCFAEMGTSSAMITPHVAGSTTARGAALIQASQMKAHGVHLEILYVVLGKRMTGVPVSV